MSLHEMGLGPLSSLPTLTDLLCQNGGLKPVPSLTSFGA